MNTAIEAPKKRRFSGKQVLLIVLGTFLVTAIITALLVRYYFFKKEFRPVTLNNKEQAVLEAKLDRLEGFTIAAAQGGSASSDTGELTPEAYSEDDAKREISLTEKELNSLLAKNTELASKLAIDLSDNLASAKMLIPVDPDFPFLGGKTLRVNAGMEVSFTNDRPVVILKGVSVMGVPIPNAWLGNLKNVDLVSEFGDAGFWRAFSQGIEYVQVADGELQLKLKE